MCGWWVVRWVLSAGCHTDQHPSSRKKSLAGMKRSRAEADGDSDAEDPGAPPEAEGVGQQEEEDEAEYFRQAVGKEPDEGAWQESVRPGIVGLFLCPGGPDSLFLQTCSQRPDGDGPMVLQARSGG